MKVISIVDGDLYACLDKHLQTLSDVGFSSRSYALCIHKKESYFISYSDGNFVFEEIPYGTFFLKTFEGEVK